MKILVIGGGGREHAIAWKLSKSPRVKKLYIAPGNPGTALLGENVAIPAEDMAGLCAFAKRENIDLAVVGPEVPLAMGIADEFAAAGIKIFGPTKAAAEIEGSKVFAKDLMKKHGIPCAFSKKFDSIDVAKTYVNTHNAPFVIKADGLAAGKGVIICRTREEALLAVDLMMGKMAFGRAGARILVEEFLVGEEASFLAVTDGVTTVPLAPAQDHKAVFDDDKGPNTGGMGAYSPAPVITPALQADVMDRIMRPTLKAMETEGRPYKGVLYAGLMMTKDGPKVLEFNCRFGDPETQPILMRLESDLVDVIEAVATGTLDKIDIRWSDKSAVCVVMASKGYPGDYETGKPISGMDAAEEAGAVVFQSGTALKNGRIVTAGGRVLGVTATGADTRQAVEAAYRAVSKITWDGAHFRRDIGKKALK